MTEQKWGGSQFFYLWLGEGHNFFVSVQGEGQIFLGALFKKLVALPPPTPPPPLNNDTSLTKKCMIVLFRKTSAQSMHFAETLKKKVPALDRPNYRGVIGIIGEKLSIFLKSSYNNQSVCSSNLMKKKMFFLDNYTVFKLQALS